MTYLIEMSRVSPESELELRQQRPALERLHLGRQRIRVQRSA